MSIFESWHAYIRMKETTSLNPLHKTSSLISFRLLTTHCNSFVFAFWYSLILYALIPSHALFSFSSPPASQETICNYTTFPGICMSIQPQNKSATIHDLGRFSVQKSLISTKILLSVVNDYLKSPQALSETTIRALEDCRFLLGLNIGFITSSAEAIKFNVLLQSLPVDDTHTLLSATLTNQDTCLDELQASPSASILKYTLLGPLSDGSKLHSISLALFKHGWVPNRKKSRWLEERTFPFSGAKFDRKSLLPVKMSSQDGRMYESVSGRKLIQTTWGSVNVSQMVVVNSDGSGDFINISDAVAAAPNNTKAGEGYFMIYVVAGIYEEYVTIPCDKKYLLMVGDGINRTIITGNHSVVDNYTTFSSATFAVTGTGFVAINITIRNTAGAIKQQAVALRNGADLSTFYKCSFEGYQDTLYTHCLRQFYRECDIYGTVDFIFGNAAVVFQNCNLYPRLPMQGQFNAITAQGRTDICQNTGTSIQNCTITSAPDLASNNGTTKTYLGRPWKEYSTTVYMQSFMDSLIDPAGWSAWSGDFALSTLYYAEYNNTGPGSNTSNRVTWPGYHVINATDAANFTVSNFISGDYWLPQTGVPYTGGLL